MFHADLPVDTQVTSEYLITVKLYFSFIKRWCVHQTRPEKETRLSATFFAHT